MPVDEPIHRSSYGKAGAGGHRVDHEIRQPRMAARRPELQNFDHAGHGDRDQSCQQPIAPIGKSEGEADQNEGKRMLAALAEISMWPQARRTERGKGDGGGEAPGDKAKNECHARQLARSIPQVRDALGAWLIAVS